MNINEWIEVTEQIVIERGSARLELDCYLERISAENKDYEKLARAERAARYEDSSAMAAQEVVTNANYIYSQLMPEGGKPLSVKQIEAKRKELEAEVARLAEVRVGTEDAVIRSKAERIAYLTKSWSMTQTVDGTEQPVELTVDALLKYCSLPVLTFIIDKIEQTVMGPLVSTLPSTSS